MTKPVPPPLTLDRPREVSCPRCETRFPFLEYDLPGGRRYLKIGPVMVFSVRLECQCGYVWFWTRGKATELTPGS
jgi:hypothetical protein